MFNWTKILVAAVIVLGSLAVSANAGHWKEFILIGEEKITFEPNSNSAVSYDWSTDFEDEIQLMAQSISDEKHEVGGVRVKLPSVYGIYWIPAGGNDPAPAGRFEYRASIVSIGNSSGNVYSGSPVYVRSEGIAWASMESMEYWVGTFTSGHCTGIEPGGHGDADHLVIYDSSHGSWEYTSGPWELGYPHWFTAGSSGRFSGHSGSSWGWKEVEGGDGIAFVALNLDVEVSSGTTDITPFQDAVMYAMGYGGTSIECYSEFIPE